MFCTQIFRVLKTTEKIEFYIRHGQGENFEKAKRVKQGKYSEKQQKSHSNSQRAAMIHNSGWEIF